MGKFCKPNQSRGLLRVLRIVVTAMKYDKKNNKNNSFNHLINSDDTGIRDACRSIEWNMGRFELGTTA